MGDFVRPEQVRLSLSSGGRFVVVKKRLNQGERDDLMAQVREVDSDGKVRINRRDYRRAVVNAYLLAWSLTDGDIPGEGLPVPMSPEMPEADRIATLRNLDPETFDDIYRAIDQHVADVEFARAAQKKILSGATGSSAISPLLVDSAGVTSGSTN